LWNGKLAAFAWGINTRRSGDEFREMSALGVQGHETLAMNIGIAKPHSTGLTFVIQKLIIAKFLCVLICEYWN
jgi:hypothetical protein